MMRIVMKLNRFTILLMLAAVFIGCEQKLPYDLDGVEKSVAINIAKPLGSGAAMSTDMTDEFDIVLSIPSQQGDWSMLDEAQLMAIYTPAKGLKTAKHVVEGIKDFPCTLKVSLADVCQKMGIEELSVGDRIEFTPCHTLKSGTQVDGWSELTGFNNTYFSGWVMEDGSKFSNRVSYSAFAPFQKEKFQGTQAFVSLYYENSDVVEVTQIDEAPPAEYIPVGVSADKLVGLSISGFIWFDPSDTFKMWINTLDFTLIIPDQTVCESYTYDDYGTYPGEVAYCEGEVNTLENSLTFYFYSIWGPYSLGDDMIKISFE